MRIQFDEYPTGRIPAVFNEALPFELAVEIAHQFCAAYRPGEHKVLDELCRTMMRDFMQQGLPSEALPDAMRSDLAALPRLPSINRRTA